MVKSMKSTDESVRLKEYGSPFMLNIVQVRLAWGTNPMMVL